MKFEIGKSKKKLERKRVVEMSSSNGNDENNGGNLKGSKIRSFEVLVLFFFCFLLFYQDKQASLLKVVFKDKVNCLHSILFLSYISQYLFTLYNYWGLGS